MVFEDAWQILKIRSAAPPRKPKPLRRVMRPAAPEPTPEPPKPDPITESLVPKQMRDRAVLDHINRIRRKRDKFDERQEVVPTSQEELDGDLEDIDYDYFLTPPSER